MQKNSWIKRVAEQSWEPELLISGLAIYATLQAPDLFYNALQYYKLYMQTEWGFVEEVLPLLIYTLFVSASYLLTLSFIVHFVIRAYWVGMIGLYSVFQDGIAFEKIQLSKLYQRFLRRKLGERDRMPDLVDNVASSIFSVSFVVVFILLAVGFIYSVIFALLNLTKGIIPAEIYEIYTWVILGIFFLIAIWYLARMLYLNRKKVRDDPATAKKLVKFSWKSNQIVLPAVYQSVMYILYTFQTNVRSSRFIAVLSIMSVGYMVSIFTVMQSVSGTQLMDGRDFLRQNSPEATMLKENYEQFHANSEYRTKALIEDPVISRKVLPLFIPYQRMMDVRLNQICERSAIEDSLSRGVRRSIANRESMECVESYFDLKLDREYDLDPEFFYSQHKTTGQVGFRTYIRLPDSLAEGRHELRIITEALTERDIELSDSDRLQIFEDVIPFWYYRD